MASTATALIARLLNRFLYLFYIKALHIAFKYCCAQRKNFLGQSRAGELSYFSFLGAEGSGPCWGRGSAFGDRGKVLAAGSEQGGGLCVSRMSGLR